MEESSVGTYLDWVLLRRVVGTCHGLAVQFLTLSQSALSLRSTSYAHHNAKHGETLQRVPTALIPSLQFAF